MFIPQKLLKQWHMDNVMDTVFFIVCKIYFRFEGNIKYAKKTLEIPLVYHSAQWSPSVFQILFV